MLRITAYENPPYVTFQLDGCLTGPWATELEKCWRRKFFGSNKPALRVDLTGVIVIDEAGKACLATMHEQGTQFITTDRKTGAVIEEIASAHCR